MTYMVQARLKRSTGGSEGALLRLIAQGQTEPWRQHNLVWTIFGDTPKRARDFVFRIDTHGGRPSVLAYCDREPDRVSDIWDVCCQRYAPDLRPGDRLRFSLRANPVKQRREADGRHKRVDVIYDAYKQAKEAAAGKDWPDRLEVANKAGKQWLAGERAAAIGLQVEPEEIAVTAYQARTVPNGTKRRHGFILSTIDMTGIATVRDPDRLVAALPKGIGRGKAYGCGMLLIARA